MAKQQTIHFTVSTDCMSDTGESCYDYYHATRECAVQVIRAARQAGAYIEPRKSGRYYIEPEFSGNAAAFFSAI